MSTQQQYTPPSGEKKARASASDRIAATLRTLFEPGDVFEIRIPQLAGGGVASGYFDDVEQAAAAAAKYDGKAAGIFVTLNPVKADLLARAVNRLRTGAEAKPTTADTDIARRRWLLLDADPQRASGISSSAQEHDAAQAWIQRIVLELVEQEGWPEPLVGDSGNGAHALFPLDLPADEASCHVLKQLLGSIAARFNDPTDASTRIALDQTVYNASRISKLYGTRVRKGDSTADRPHRRSRLVTVPATLNGARGESLRPALTLDQMQEHIEHYPPADDHDHAGAGGGPGGASSNNGGGGKRAKIVDARAYLTDHQIVIASERAGPHGETTFVLAQCVWDETHANDHAAIVQQWADGHITAKCSHNSCAGKGWRDFREAVEGPTAATQSQADRLLQYIKPMFDEPGNEIFRDPAGEGYATVPVHDHHETHRLRSRPFKLWVGRQFYLNERTNPQPNAVQLMVAGLEARAYFDSPTRDVHLRLAPGEPNHIWLDLGTPDHAAVQVTADGWRVVADPPIKFRRKRGMLPLPVPVKLGEGETLKDLLRPFVNLRPDADGDRDWVLLVTYLCATLRPTGPFPVLQLHGEQGSAKSTLARLLRRLVDPNKAELSGEPSSVRDLAIAAENSWVMAYDNLRFVPPWLSDALCRLSTGDGFRARELYSDDEEALFAYQRPVLLTGVDEVVTRPDLLDRTLSITLKRIPQPKDEASFWGEFDAAAPRIVGALLDVVSGALQVAPTISRANLPRMADFSIWSQAVEQALGWQSGAFAAAYEHTRRDAREVALEASIVYPTLLRWLNVRRGGPETPGPSWEGNMDSLLKELDGQRKEEHDDEHGYSRYAPRAPKGWPSTPRGLSGIINGLQSHLRAVGIEVEFLPHGRRYRVTDRRDAEQAVQDGYTEEDPNAEDLYKGNLFTGGLYEEDEQAGQDQD